MRNWLSQSISHSDFPISHCGPYRNRPRQRQELASFHRAAILPEPYSRGKAHNCMHFEARIEPLNGKLPKVSYRWDPETDILTVACKGVTKGNGMNGTVDLEGGDGSFVVIDVAGGALRGLEGRAGHVSRSPVPTRRGSRGSRYAAHRRQESG